MDTDVRKPRSGVLTGTELNLISDALAGRYNELCGRAALDPSAIFDDDVLEFSFRNGLTGPELGLRESGDMERLRRFREKGLVVTGAQLARPVEALVRSHVGFHLGLFDSEEEETRLLFGFETPASIDPEELLSWSAAMRKRAREVRAEGADVRRTSAELRRHFREQRAERAKLFADSDDE
jgi:hypothetical protein